MNRTERNGARGDRRNAGNAGKGYGDLLGGPLQSAFSR
jgi:hypothetical protein